MKCKKCGAELSKGSKNCPNCGTKQHSLGQRICYLVIALAVGIIIGTAINSFSNHAPDSAQSQEPQPSDEIILFDGTSAKATFLKAYEEKSISGAFYLQLLIENKSDSKEEWIYLNDAYVDGLAANTGSGVPMVIKPGKSSNSPFIIFYDGDLDNVEKVEFQLVVADHSTSATIEESDTLTITLDKS